MRYDVWYQREIGVWKLMAGILAETSEDACDYVASAVNLPPHSTVHVYPCYTKESFFHRPKPQWERVRRL